MMADYRLDRKRADRALREKGIVVVMSQDHVRTPEHMVVTMEKVAEFGYVPEMTFRVDLGIISEAMEELRTRRAQAATDGRELMLAAGSVIDDDDLDKAVELGFDVIVGPGTVATGGSNVARRLREVQDLGHAVAPSALTPSEMQFMLRNAEGFEPDAIKLFPAGVYGPKGVADLLAPFGRPKHLGKIIMPTGGLDGESAVQYIKAIRSRGFEACVGLSSPLQFVRERKQPGNVDAIMESLETFARGFPARENL